MQDRRLPEEITRLMVAQRAPWLAITAAVTPFIGLFAQSGYSSTPSTASAPPAAQLFAPSPWHLRSSHHHGRRTGRRHPRTHRLQLDRQFHPRLRRPGRRLSLEVLTPSRASSLQPVPKVRRMAFTAPNGRAPKPHWADINTPAGDVVLRVAHHLIWLRLPLLQSGIEVSRPPNPHSRRFPRNAPSSRSTRISAYSRATTPSTINQIAARLKQKIRDPRATKFNFLSVADENVPFAHLPRHRTGQTIRHHQW